MKVLCILLFSVFLCAGIYASERKRDHVIPEVSEVIKADGVMDEKVWENALMLELNYEVGPGENIKPPVRTEVRFMYTKTHLMVSFKAYDPDTSRIRARICDRDTINPQDHVTVVFDTFNDERSSYNFSCNPFGVQMDAIETPQNYHGRTSWDTIWDSGGKITEYGYCVEMLIPFRAIKFQRNGEGRQTWRVDALRIYPRTNRHRISLFPRDRNNNSYLNQADTISGFKGIRAGKNLEFSPVFSAHVSDSRDAGTHDKFERKKKYEPGLTAKWGFTNNLTLSATVNPDFSQVEADAPQMDVNEPFAIFFPEKRPFFTEGSDYFNTRLDAVYTRIIRDPSWGVKITGKEGPHTIGVYTVKDTVTNLLFPGSTGSSSASVDINNQSSVVRYKYDINDRYTVGGLVTGRKGSGYHNWVYGVDGDFRITSKDKISVQFLSSDTKYGSKIVKDHGVRGDKFRGGALDIFYRHSSRNINWFAGYKDMGEDFRADLGFIPKVGYRSLFAGTTYRWYADSGKWWERTALELEYDQEKEYGGILLKREVSLKFTLSAISQIHAFAEVKREKRYYGERSYNLNEFKLHHCQNIGKDVFIWFTGRYGDRIDYSNYRKGKRLRLKGMMRYEIGRYVKLNLTHTYERMTAASARLYTANQSEVKCTWQFNKKTFFRGVVQYADYRFNSSNYINGHDPVEKHLFTQFLFSYKLNPQTVLFLGYSDNYYNDPNSRYKNLITANRAVFLKIGYALIL